MGKIFNFLLLIALPSFQLNAQIFPNENSKVCYRIIGFSFPTETNALRYRLQIAHGNQNNEAIFEKNIFLSVNCSKSKTIAEVPSFGCDYTWRILSFDKNGLQSKGALHHFTVKYIPDIDSNITRLKVENKVKKNKDYYVFLDGARTLYDMNGEPVWFLPGADMKANQNAYPRDLKATPQGSITFITGYKPYEITYDGNILWHYTGKTARQNLDTFHHDFTRLRNGNHMGMLFENKITYVPLYKDSIASNAEDSVRFFRQMKFNTIIEYDKNQNVVWQWNCYDYIKKSDLYDHKDKDGLFDLNDLHENGFYFDEKNKYVYLSFRNINRIIKIKYPEGTVVNTYGTIFAPGVSSMKNDLFCGQHSCKISQNGYLYMFNNNTCSADHIPTVLVLRESPERKNKLEKIWEYQCVVDDLDGIGKNNLVFNSGGSATELPDGSFFASTGFPYCKVFIVGKDKRLLWSASPRKFDPVAKKWKRPGELYRSSIISRKELETLIWNSQK